MPSIRAGLTRQHAERPDAADPEDNMRHETPLSTSSNLSRSSAGNARVLRTDDVSRPQAEFSSPAPGIQWRRSYLKKVYRRAGGYCRVIFRRRRRYKAGSRRVRNRARKAPYSPSAIVLRRAPHDLLPPFVQMAKYSRSGGPEKAPAIPLRAGSQRKQRTELTAQQIEIQVRLVV